MSVVVPKFESFVRIFNIIIISPRVRKAFKLAVEQANFYKIVFDEGDRYHVGRRNDYNYLGIPFNKRYQDWIDVHNGNLPPLITKV